MPPHGERLLGVELGGASPRRRVHDDLPGGQPGRQSVHVRLDAAAARRKVVGDDHDLWHLDGYLTHRCHACRLNSQPGTYSKVALGYGRTAPSRFDRYQPDSCTFSTLAPGTAASITQPPPTYI